MSVRIAFPFLLALVTAAGASASGPEPIPLWPEGPPGGGSPGLSVLRAYPAPAESATGAAVVVCPGGGYAVHAIDHEGQQVARWFNRFGVSAFVLSYRLGERHPHPAPLQDAQRALRHVRANATALGVAPDRIGIMGFSAGGHLASTAATRFDGGDPDAADPVERVSSRPDFAILGYPVISFTEPFTHQGSRRNLLGPRVDDPALREALSGEKQVTPQTPPTFLFHTGEDAGVPVENSLAFYAALRRAGVPGELHVYQYGPHGVGLAPGDPVLSTWADRLAGWLRTTGFLAGGERVGLSGSVRADGTALARGTITFEPEDRNAPVAWSSLRDGAFEIPAQRGPVPGPHRVVVRDLGAVALEPTIDDTRVVATGRHEVPVGGGEVVVELAGSAAARSLGSGPAAPLRVGVAGLTHTHVHWLLGRADRGDVEIVGVAEPNRDLAERYFERHGLPMSLLYPDLESMLEGARPEAVTAFGTIREHLGVVEACAPRGIHVMVEKPLAVSLDHGLRMAALAREHGIHLLTNYETTWYGSNARVRQLAQDGTLGEIRKMVIHDGHPGPVKIGVNDEFLEWLTDPHHNGAGALTDFGCYGADLMTWLMDGERPTSVMAVTQQLQPDLYPKVDDEATILVTWPRAQGVIQASWNWPYNRKDTHVYGVNGYAKALDPTRLRIKLGDRDEREESAAPLEDPFDDPFAYLAGVVRGRIDPGAAGLSSLELNLTVMEILDAAMRSAASGERVELPAEAPAHRPGE